MKIKELILFFLALTFSLFSHGQCVNCTDNSNIIRNNQNGSFTSTASAQAYYWEICQGSTSIVGSNTGSSVNVSSCNGSYKIKLTRFVNGDCIEACKTITCGTTLSCPQNASIQITTEGNADGDCTGSLAILHGVNPNDIAHVNWSWRLGPRNGGLNGTIVNGTVSAAIFYPMNNWTNYYLVVSAEIVLTDGTVCSIISTRSLLDCGSIGSPFGFSRRSNSKTSIYPNPTTNHKFSISIQDEMKVSEIVIKNANGNLVKSIKNYDNNEIDLSGHENGLYFVSVKFENGTIETSKLFLR